MLALSVLAFFVSFFQYCPFSTNFCCRKTCHWKFYKPQMAGHSLLDTLQKSLILIISLLKLLNHSVVWRKLSLARSLIRKYFLLDGAKGMGFGWHRHQVGFWQNTAFKKRNGCDWLLWLNLKSLLSFFSLLCRFSFRLYRWRRIFNACLWGETAFEGKSTWILIRSS